MKLDPNAKYQDSHEWARKAGDLIVCGISDHAQIELGDVVYVELPQVGSSLNRGEEFGTVESVKAVSQLFMPMSGQIVEINEALTNEPEIINDDPYGEGWLIKIKPSNPGEWDNLLSGDAYKRAIAEE